ncbi:MAG TPA: hypothetical protein DCM71_15905 [Runella sp.]|nr:hypothetical protein [Runella sp.]
MVTIEVLAWVLTNTTKYVNCRFRKKPFAKKRYQKEENSLTQKRTFEQKEKRKEKKDYLARIINSIRRF